MGGGVGIDEGREDGMAEGETLGERVGGKEGENVGVCDGKGVTTGEPVGEKLGNDEGVADDKEVGVWVGVATQDSGGVHVITCSTVIESKRTGAHQRQFAQEATLQVSAKNLI